MEATVSTLLENRIIAIVRGVDPDHFVPMARALRDGGIRCVEITFNQKDPSGYIDTQRGITALREAFPDLAVGAGTVTSPDLARKAVEAGAGYIISPNMDPAVIAATKELGAVSIPGCMTPTEAMEAHRHGADIIKLFPAGVLGPAYVRALCDPLSHLTLFAVGGISADNIPAFRKAGARGFGVGGSLVRNDLIAAGNYDALRLLARQFAQAALDLIQL